MNKPRLIVIEGLDGSGKSTQLKLLSKRLTRLNIDYKEISFPAYEKESSALVRMYLGGEFGDKPGDVGAYAAATFYAVDRYASFVQDWKMDYSAGVPIIAGRYATSNAIHQMTKLEESKWDEFLDWLWDFEYNKLEIPPPDAVIFLNMPVEISQKLLSGRYSGDETQKDIHERDLEYLEKCTRGAKYAACREGWHIIDCAEDDAPKAPENIAEEIYNIVKSKL